MRCNPPNTAISNGDGVAAASFYPCGDQPGDESEPSNFMAISKSGRCRAAATVLIQDPSTVLIQDPSNESDSDESDGSQPSGSKKKKREFPKYQVHQRVRDVRHYSRGVVKSIGTQGICRSLQARLHHTVRTADLRINKFITFADKISLPFTLEDLRKVRNNKKTAAEMEERCRELEKDKYLPRPFSAQYFDKKGAPIFFYLGERLADERPKSYTLTTCSQENFITQLDGRQQKDLDAAVRNQQKLMADGFDPSFLRSYHERTQHLFHHVQPQISGPEKRHLFDSKEQNPRIIQFQDRATGETVEERKGVLHIVQCWTAQGKPNEPCPGGAYSASNDARLAIEHYYEASSPVAMMLARFFKRLFPVAYEKSAKAFAAGVWVNGDPGPWLGRALIYKLQGSLHVDDKDEGPTVSFPCGHFSGGEMIVPQLDIKFSYKAGHICFFESADVFHYVAKFTTPSYYSDRHNTTPGRIGSVFFTPQLSMKHLQGKKKGWANDTKYGRHPPPIF